MQAEYSAFAPENGRGIWALQISIPLKANFILYIQPFTIWEDVGTGFANSIFL
jgi:hypothetical protein